MKQCMTYPQWICYLQKQITELEEQIDTQTSLVLFGNEKPENDIGKNGDIYFQFDGAFVYLKKNDIWKLQGELSMSKVDGGDF